MKCTKFHFVAASTLAKQPILTEQFRCVSSLKGFGGFVFHFE